MHLTINRKHIKGKQVVIIFSILLIFVVLLYIIIINYFLGIEGPSNMSILSPPPTDAPLSVINRYHAIILHAASPSAVLVIKSGCQNSPLVMKIKNGDTFRIHNTDTIEHLIVFDELHRYHIATSNTVTLHADFPNSGIIPYTCDGLMGNRGFFVIDK